jgi:hypothetical protein
MYAIPEKKNRYQMINCTNKFQCALRLPSIVMMKNKRLQVQSRVVFIMNEHFNNYNPWWPHEDITFCPSCPCCFADCPRIHTDFSLIPRCDNPWKDVDFAFSLWAVLYMYFWKSKKTYTNQRIFLPSLLQIGPVVWKKNKM